MTLKAPPVSERLGDIVLTPAWVAADMVTHFRPDGLVLDPCKGPGVFLDYLPADTDWCEITAGRDFFQWTKRVDWVVGNPPYSLTREWFRHSYTIAENLLYLIPLRNLFSGYGFLREIHGFGGIAAIRLYGTGGSLGFPMGNAVGAVHVQRGYRDEVRGAVITDATDRDAGGSSGEQGGASTR